MRSDVGPLRGGADGAGTGCVAGPPRLFLASLGTLVTGEEWGGGACVGGEPVEVFVVKRFRGVTGCVDDADCMVVLQDWYGEGVRPAGVRAGLRVTPGSGDREGRVAGLDDQLDHAPVGGGGFAGR